MTLWAHLPCAVGGMDDLFAFPETLDSLTTSPAVCAEMLRRLELTGLNAYAIGARPHPEDPYPTSFLDTNLPRTWTDGYFDREFGPHDPVLRALDELDRPFTLGDLRSGRSGLNLRPDEIEVLDFGASLGFAHGYIMPIYRAHGYRGIACISGRGPDPDQKARARLHFILDHAHDRLRALWLDGASVPAGLSTRERQVLGLAQKGRTDKEIALATGITVRTVRFHFENARHKLGAHTRAQAVAAAASLHMLTR